MDEEFYWYLPSNVDGHLATNTASTWTTHFKSWRYLDWGYEVGLKQISYPNTWFNVREQQKITFVPVNRNYRDGPLPIYVPKGRYSTLESLVTTINNKIKAATTWVKAPTLLLDVNSSTMILESGQESTNTREVMYVEFSEGLNEIIGKLDLDKRVTAPISEPKGGIHSIYVYTSIIKHRLVGDEEKQLLAVIPVEKTLFGSQNHTTIQSPIYHPLNANSIAHITLKLTDEKGKPIHFEDGDNTRSSLIILHFRKI